MESAHEPTIGEVVYPIPENVPGAKTYPLTTEAMRDLMNRFTYHAPTKEQTARYEYLRSQFRLLSYEIKQFTPPSTREQSLALTHLEESLFWANAAIARNE